MIRFIHTADLHLDSPFKGLQALHPDLFEQVYQAGFHSFQNIIETAINKQVDFVLISGDIYDEENQSVKAQAFFRDQMKKLEQHQIPVFLSHGNHDFMGRESLRIQMPNNVTIFGIEPETHEMMTKDQEKVAITGFSYQTRWVKERMINQYPNRKQSADYHLGMLHGYLDGSKSEEATYAPFSIDDLLTRQYDYWALGHIHKRSTLHSEPPILYSGNIQGRNPNEVGEKGAYLVTLEKGSASEIEFFPTAPIIWLERTVSLEGVSHLSDLFAKVEKEMETVSDETVDILLSVQFSDYEGLSKDLMTRIQSGDLLEGINQTDRQPFVYLYHLALLPKKDQLLFSYDADMQASFVKGKAELNEDERYQDALQDLFKHSIIRSRFNELEQDQQLKQAIIDAAESILMSDIAFEEGEEEQ